MTRLRRIAYLMVIVAAVLYAPLAVNYMWFTVNADAPQWQEAITAAINGGDYAYRAGSVDSIREVDYLDNSWVMLTHTVLGGLALLLAVHQLSPRLRHRNLARHRWVGRTYFVLMTVSMATALVFLLRAGVAHYLGGNGFYLQLWALDLGTLVTGFMALRAIRRRDLIGHQSWIYLNFALMMTAPLLRVVWTFLAPAFPDHVLLDNLDMGASMLGVIAPGGAAVAMQWTLHSRRAGSTETASARSYAALGAAAAAAAAALALRFGQVDDVIPRGVLYLPLACSVGYTVICLLGIWRARVAADATLELRWRWLAWGAALAPLGVVAVHLATAVLWGSPAGMIGALMVGFTGPIVVSYVLVARWIAGRAPSLREDRLATTAPSAA
ncbi:DUF2306 domain-containing protein [Rhodococcus daqingensis]|uniref:DUF2306 domain-containing protein n=1 Tax=Rhodococcus daqingensis TaxID=2479363 RepID=A0ABW2S5Y2_9NOCA